ncbi:hypothetical protein Ancab_002544 [Ancistrocladus abbreviatus]
MLGELKTIWIGSFKLIVDSARNKNRQGKQRNSPTSNDVKMLATTGPARSTVPEKAPVQRHQKTFAEVANMEWLKGSLVIRVHDVEVDECTVRKKSFEMAWLLVLTPSTGLINKAIHVKVNAHKFTVMVVEKVGGSQTSTGRELELQYEELGAKEESGTVLGALSITISRVPDSPNGEIFGNVNSSDFSTSLDRD